MKALKIIIIIVAVVGISFSVNFLLLSKFNTGDCIKDNEGYTWQINDFSLGIYTAMGWQDNSWGNATEIDKEVLESKGTDGIQVYNKIVCPEYTPSSNDEIIDSDDTGLQDRLLIYRSECQIEYNEKVETVDNFVQNTPNITSEQAKNLAINAGIADSDGYIINEDIWVKNCMDDKEEIFE